MNTTQNRYQSLEEFLATLNVKESLDKNDKMFLTSIVKRQHQVLADLVQFSKKHPQALDKDIIGGLYSIFSLLDNQAQSLIFG
ncbi:MAG: hypothetical protein ACI4MV_06510 [Christensenellales bacterium]